MFKIAPHIYWAVGIMFVLFIAAIMFRPLLPIDETRYMSVAWEMRLHEGWLSPLTMNFEPYHHKPPMLFWLINIFWSVFGVSRWAGLVPITLMSLAVVFLSVRLGKKIIAPDTYDPMRITLLICGSVPFVIYSTLIMFDLSVAVLVLVTVLALINYAHERKFTYVLLAGLAIGLGVLTKGPVAYLYVIFPVLFAPFWVKDFSRPLSWYGGCFAVLLISLIPISTWIIPVLLKSDNHFAFWLLWEQTAGRVTGNFGDAHVRPWYFYLPIALAMLMPWILFPAFWKNLKTLDRDTQIFRFVACWIIPTLLSFCLISGKQPHYLLPLLPGVVLLLSSYLARVDIEKIKILTLIMIATAVIGQGVSSKTVFKSYDLRPISDYVGAHQDRDWAFVRNYHGEVGFLAKMEKPIADVSREDIDQWFKKNPRGLAIIRYKNIEEVKQYKNLVAVPYRGKNLGIFVK